MSDRAQRLAGWLRDHAHAGRARGFVFGLSGGIDSAVVGRLCQMAMPEGVMGVLLPCYSDPQDEADGRLVAEAFGIPTLRVDLGPAFDALSATLQATVTGDPSLVGVVDIKQKMPSANIKPRLRMTSLYYIANSLNSLVVGTGNRSEITLGYYTKYGDGGVDLLPIGALLKSEVRTLARELGVPQPIIDKAPSAGLWAGQTDEAEMGFTYEALEQYLADRSSVSAATAARIDQLRASSNHKRALPPIG